LQQPQHVAQDRLAQRHFDDWLAAAGQPATLALRGAIMPAIARVAHANFTILSFRRVVIVSELHRYECQTTLDCPDFVVLGQYVPGTPPLTCGTSLSAFRRWFPVGRAFRHLEFLAQELLASHATQRHFEAREGRPLE
jgi:hypothetical protein